jgi:hypothetical protein
MQKPQRLLGLLCYLNLTGKQFKTEFIKRQP